MFILYKYANNFPLASVNGIAIKSTAVLLNVLSEKFRKQVKKKGWNGEIRIWMALGRRKSDNTAMT